MCLSSFRVVDNSLAVPSCLKRELSVIALPASRATCSLRRNNQWNHHGVVRVDERNSRPNEEGDQ